MIKNYWWFLFTIPILTLLLFYGNVLIRRRLIKQRGQITKNSFIWIIFIVIGLLLFFQWLLDSRFHSIVYLIFSMVWIVGGIFRLIQR